MRPTAWMDESLAGAHAEPLVYPAIQALPGQFLANVATPVDSGLDQTLGAMGDRLGEGELTLLSHHCSGG